MPLNDTEILARVESIGEQDGNLLDIGEAALLLAHLDLPKNNLAEYLDELDLISSDLSDASRGAKNLPDRITALSDTLYNRHGYDGDGDTYDDPQNANLKFVYSQDRKFDVTDKPFLGRI